VVPIYGSCDVQPTYASQVRLNRWPSFPLGYYLDATTFPAEFLEEYTSAIEDGIRRWDAATANDLGAVVEVQDPDDAHFVISYRHYAGPVSSARTVHSNGTPFLAGGQIWFNPSGMAEGEDLYREGRISRATFVRVTSSIAAHEMGHLMGIIGHTTRTDAIMGPEFVDAPTVVDVNTLIRAYCQP
jgi:predicted Zn-dependent protease